MVAVPAEGVMGNALTHVLLPGETLVSGRLDGLNCDMQTGYLVASSIDSVLRPLTNPLFDLILIQFAAEAL